MLISPHIDALIQLALQEDLGAGDLTSELTIPAAHQSRARILARERLVVCGLFLVERIAKAVDTKLEVSLLFEDGDTAKPDEVLAELRGPTRSLLAAERTILNFLQRLGGVATHARRLSEQAKGLTLLDTRKTTPGWRTLEKYAVRVGGAANHRGSLGDMILVKNNHIDANGGDVRATLRKLSKRPPYVGVEVEVRTLKELSAALEFEPDVVMLDNMDDSMISQALAIVAKADHQPLVEVSGCVRPERFARLKSLGVTHASLGLLTSGAASVDISMRIVASSEKPPKSRSKKK
jgi:nicotinate-nucleotide pyrophosphorylase (carboxylating)